LTLNIGIEIPEDHITQKCSMFGVTGTGKSNGLGVILEEYCKNNLPFVVVDVLGAHYGLAEKYEVIIYGGKKGTVLDKEVKGNYYAHIVYNAKSSVIFDLSEWNDFEMQLWMAEFLDELFKLHGMNRVPRHIFVEEAEVFFPQNGYDESKKSLLAGNKVMKRGRALGLGMTLISQRPQDVNKKTLSQAQAHFLLHLEGVPEMKVVNEMLRSESADNRKLLVNKVTKAQKGECLLYSPQWMGKNNLFKFRLRETFHAGYTPEVGKEVIEPKLNHLVEPVIVEKEEGHDGTDKVDKALSNRSIFIIGAILAIMMYWVTSVT